MRPNHPGFSRSFQSAVIRHDRFHFALMTVVTAIAVGALLILGWILWQALHVSQADTGNGLLQIWDGFLFIVREVGKAWRGQ